MCFVYVTMLRNKVLNLNIRNLGSPVTNSLIPAPMCHQEYGRIISKTRADWSIHQLSAEHSAKFLAATNFKKDFEKERL